MGFLTQYCGLHYVYTTGLVFESWSSVFLWLRSSNSTAAGFVFVFVLSCTSWLPLGFVPSSQFIRCCRGEGARDRRRCSSDTDKCSRRLGLLIVRSNTHVNRRAVIVGLVAVLGLLGAGRR